MTSTITAADVLRGAADAFRTGAIHWGTEVFHDPMRGCRCALGAIAYSADPAALLSSPYGVNAEVLDATAAAVSILGEYLTEELGAPRCYDEDQCDLNLIETIGGWNDEPGRTAAEVIAALLAAAERTAGDGAE